MIDEESSMNVVDWLLQTDSGVTGLILRLTLTAVMFPHGAQKALGWFGGHGFKGTMKYFTDSGIPTGFALLAIAAEFLGSLGFAVGLLTRVAAFGIACVMLVAIITVHWPHGFFINWYGNQKGEGIEYHLLALGIAITLIIVGAGTWSLDGALASTR
jgi:putative oxidoreductase